MTLFQAIILAVVEGLTEYLPISSTGHLIITSSLMGIAHEPFTKNFTVIVQFGAILSVLVLYWKRFFEGRKLYFRLFVAFLPAAVIGLLVKDHIDALLDNVQVVAIALILGGVVLILVDRWFAKMEGKARPLESMDMKNSVVVGFFQCLAFIPGVSRSAATIIGGLTQNLTRQAAAEFSFLLAVPTLTAATALKSYKVYQTIEPGQINLILAGNMISFLVGTLAIKAFVGFLTRRGFFLFGVYRIIVGTLILALLGLGYDLQVM